MLRTKTETTTIIRAKSNIIAVLLAFFLFSCDTHMVYDTWETIPDNAWNKDSILVFTPEVKDSVNPVNLIIGVRNTNAYPYSNLWLFVTTQTPSGLSKKDTFEVELASPYGKWYGSGWGNTFTSLHYYSKNVLLSEGGKYAISVQHGMRRDTLPGVNAVGFRIENVTETE